MFKNKLLLFALGLSISMGAFFAFGAVAKNHEIEVFPVRIIMFHLETCQHCKDELEFLAIIEKKYPNIELHEFELSRNIKNQSLFSQVVERENLSGGVPVTMIADEVIVGFDNEKGIGNQLIQLIEKYSIEPGVNWLDDRLGLEDLNEDSKVSLLKSDLPSSFVKKYEAGVKSEDDQNKTIQVLGFQLSLDGEASVFGLGMLLGLADGINPCMFSVLLFLLTYLLAIGSRKRALKAGLVFVATTFVVYFLLMLGIIKVIDILAIEQYARWLIIIVALAAGLIMIKDYFFYGKWFSLEISKRFKPAIEKLIKRGTIPSAILLALLSSIVELPCTSVLPLAYVNILASRDLAPLLYLVWYNIFFILPLLVIIVAVTFAWAKVDSFEQARLKYRKWMRLGAGILLILLSISFWQNWI